MGLDGARGAVIGKGDDGARGNGAGDEGFWRGCALLSNGGATLGRLAAIKHGEAVDHALCASTAPSVLTMP